MWLEKTLPALSDSWGIKRSFSRLLETNFFERKDEDVRNTEKDLQFPTLLTAGECRGHVEEAPASRICTQIVFNCICEQLDQKGEIISLTLLWTEVDFSNWFTQQREAMRAENRAKTENV